MLLSHLYFSITGVNAHFLGVPKNTPKIYKKNINSDRSNNVTIVSPILEHGLHHTAACCLREDSVVFDLPACYDISTVYIMCVNCLQQNLATSEYMKQV